VVGTFFSYPAIGPRNLNHELHSLSTSVLDVARPGGANTWTPAAPGIDPKPIVGAPSPAGSPSPRLLQMRELTRGFTASSEDLKEKRWELRLLPQPLYRYESTDPDVLDGALFAMVSSAGTDPELMLVLEARKGAGQAEPTWQVAAARFSDMALTVKFRNAVLYDLPLVKWDAPIKDPLNRYHLNVDRTIPPVEQIDAPTTKPQEAGRKP
jgi:hypothetical protein